MNRLSLNAQAADLLYREAHHLDAQRWDEWQALYCADAPFWVPARKSEDEQTDSPDRKVSLIYLQGRSGLEDRVWRIRSGLSAASSPLPRTSHQVGAVVADLDANGELEVVSNWSCHVYDLRIRQAHVFFGRYHHRLRQLDGEWMIAGKKIVLMNDLIPTMVDIYCL